VAKRQQEISELLEANRENIESGKLVVYLIDECHLLWGDVCGYGWGVTKERYSQRNWVEVFYREAKGWLGLKEYQTRGIKSLKRHFILVF